MKIVFAREGEVVNCLRCGSSLDANFEAADGDDEENYWCEVCVDYPRKVKVQQVGR